MTMPTPRTAADGILATGLLPSQLAGAVVIGLRDAATIARARRSVPPTVPVVIVEPDGFETTIAAVTRWCIGNRVDPSRVAWWIDAASPLDASTIAGVHDVLWSHGTAWLEHAEAHDDPQTLAGPLGAWAQHLVEHGRHHGALLVFLWLERHRPSPSLATRIAIAWAQLGCPERARAWLDRSDVAAEPRAAVRADLEAEARNAALTAQEVLAHNLAALQKAWPAAAAAIEAAPTDDLELLWCTDVPWRLRAGKAGFTVERSEYPLLVRHEDGAWRPVDPPACPLAARAQLDPQRPLRDLHACIGSVADHAALVNVLGNRVSSQLPNWRQSVCVVHRDASTLRKLAEAIDLGALLCPTRIERLDVGPHAEDALVAGFVARPRQLLPRIRLGCSPALDAALDGLAIARIRERDATIAALARRYDAGFPERVQAKLAAGEPVRVWLWTSIHTTVLQHVTRGLAAGFEALGHEVCVLVEASPVEALGPADVAASLAAFEPDLVVLLDHTRPEYGPLFPENLPVAAWILDELPALVDPRVLARLGDRDLAFAWSEPLSQMYRARGYPHCTLLPFAVDPALYFADAQVPREQVVAYATHLAFPPDSPHAPGLYRALEQRMMAMDEVPSGIEPLRPLFDATLADLGITLLPEQYRDLAYQCLIVSRHVDRVKIADRVLAAGLPLALYGSGWDAIERFVPHHRGLLAPGPAMRRMYQSHAVVLHINTRCNLHPRVLETAACAGFVLARSDGEFDYAPGSVDGCLRIGRELCVFDDFDDMIAKARRAMVDEEWRRGFARAGHDRVHADHTFRARAQRMLAEVAAVPWRARHEIARTG